MSGALPRSNSNLSEDVYQQLRRDIVHGVLRPNEGLVEVEIAERLGVSRTPVRESMQRLADDGLIVSKRRRWVVYEHSPAEVAELYGVRAALESHAARLAAQTMSDEQRRALEEMREEVTSSKLEGLARVDVNEHFHDFVSQTSGNRRLATLIKRTRLYHFNTRVAALYTPDDLAVSAEQHGALIEALLEQDVEAAGRVAREHVEYALELILRKLY